jgi:hypothetical protein
MEVSTDVLSNVGNAGRVDNLECVLVMSAADMLLHCNCYQLMQETSEGGQPRLPSLPTKHTNQERRTWCGSCLPHQPVAFEACHIRQRSGVYNTCRGGGARESWWGQHWDEAGLNLTLAKSSCSGTKKALQRQLDFPPLYFGKSVYSGGV